MLQINLQTKVIILSYCKSCILSLKIKQMHIVNGYNKFCLLGSKNITLITIQKSKKIISFVPQKIIGAVSTTLPFTSRGAPIGLKIWSYKILAIRMKYCRKKAFIFSQLYTITIRKKSRKIFIENGFDGTKVKCSRSVTGDEMSVT